MRLMHRLMRLATMVVAALALTASSAMAQESPVEVLNEDTAAHCDPCTFVVTGSSSLRTHSGGVEQVIWACTDRLEGTINEDGTGSATSITLAGINCRLLPCATANGQVAWPFTVGETGPGTEHMNITFCLFNALGQFSFCQVEAAVQEDPSDPHHYLLNVNDQTCPSGVEFTSNWEIRDDDPTHDAIDIQHL